MKGLIALATCIMAVFFLASAASAIPDEEIYNFRTSVTADFYFDEQNPTHNGFSITRLIQLHAFYDEYDYYYVIIRANAADVAPYDDFFIEFTCDNEPVTSLQTTDSTSWNQLGQMSFKKEFQFTSSRTYGNSTLAGNFSYCVVTAANTLVVDGNTGYTTFKVDLVPVTDTAVTTLESYCESESIKDAVTAELSAIDTIFTANVGFFSTLFIVFQIIAIVFVVLAIPIMIFMLIKWVIYKVTGHRILERREY